MARIPAVAPAARSRPTVATVRPAYLVIAGVGIAAGFAIAVTPLVAVVVIGTGVVTVAALIAGRRSAGLFLGALGLIVAAYVFLDKGVSYAGVGQLYIGEMVLFFGVLAAALNLGRLRMGLMEALLLAFIALGAVRTLPYLGLYGLDALRDGVVWAYASFAIMVSLLMSRDRLGQLADAARGISPFFLLWVPIAAVLSTLFGSILPAWPGAPVPIVYLKHGDVGVYLAAIAASVLVGLYAERRSWLGEGALWTVWLLDLAIVGSINRGGLVAALVGGASSLLFVRSASRFMRGALIAALFSVSLYLVNPSVGLGYAGRSVSFTQLVDNAISVAVDTGGGQLDTTRAWRLAWWNKIIGYTIDGPYRWTGKGFGINLADDDGFRVDAVGSLRSPHSAHLTILARGGVPMLALWVMIQAAFGIGLARATLRARARGDQSLTRMAAVIFAFWLAALINMSFDVYLEGPQGGIPFWSAIGVGMVIMRASRQPFDSVASDSESHRTPMSLDAI